MDETVHGQSAAVPSMCDIHAVDLDCFAIRDKISSQSYRVCWITKAMTPCIADTGAQRSTNAPHIYIYYFLLTRCCRKIALRYRKEFRHSSAENGVQR